jgi:protein-tyrosine phosphatase
VSRVSSILVVCTANMCRSPLAAAMLERCLGDVSDTAGPAGAGPATERTRVSSAGFLAAGHPAHPDTQTVAREIGIDLSGHRSRTIDAAMLRSDGAGLVITMTRRHLREVSVMEPSVWPRAVTLRDLARRIAAGGGDLVSMLSSRRIRDVAADDPTDDVADPVGMPLSAHRELAAEFTSLLTGVARWWSRYGGTL